MDRGFEVSEVPIYRKEQHIIREDTNVVLKYIKNVWIKGMDIA